MQLLAIGRDADVFDGGPGRVLRRYRNPARSTVREAEVMRYVRDRGFPVPAVFDADGPDLVMERVVGPTMARALLRRPWTLLVQARALARLHQRLHAVPGPDWLSRPFGDGTSLLHLDLHAENVLMTADGPVVIDWPNAVTGPAAADVADTWLVLAAARGDFPRAQRALAAVGQGAFASTFLRAAGRDDALPLLAAVAERRIADRNLHEREREAIRRLVARHSHSA